MHGGGTTIVLAGLVVGLGPGCTVLFPFDGDRPSPGERVSCDPRPPAAGTFPHGDALTLEEWPAASAEVGVPFDDPAFGGRIVRVTNDGTSYHSENGLPSFNADSTRFILYEGRDSSSHPVVYALDDSGNDPIVTREAPAQIDCWEQDLAWSPTDPDVLYCVDSSPHRVAARDPMTGADRGSWGIDSALPDPDDEDDYVGGLSLSEGGNAVVRTDVSKRIVVVRTDVADRAALRWFDYGTFADPFPKLDLTGRYLVVESDGVRYLHDLDQAADDAPGAPLEGNGYASVAGRLGTYEVADDADLVVRRDLSRPEETIVVFEYHEPYDPTLSVPRGDPGWLLVSLCANGMSGGLYEDEILAVATDRSWVRRLAQHHAACDQYLGGARASVSHDGRYALFTVDDEEEGNTDVFLLALPCE